MLGLSNIIGVPLEIQEKYFKFKMIKTTVSPIHENNNFVSLNIYERYIEFDSCDILKKYYNMSIFEGFDFEKYLCPKPYQNISIRGRYGDGKRGFDGWTEKHEERLYEFMEYINSIGAFFMLSNYKEHTKSNNKKLNDWVKKNNFKIIEDSKITKRNRTNRKEIIVINY